MPTTKIVLATTVRVFLLLSYIPNISFPVVLIIPDGPSGIGGVRDAVRCPLNPMADVLRATVSRSNTIDDDPRSLATL